VENLNRLLDLYQADSRVQQLIKALGKDTPTRLQLVGMKGAQEAFVLNGIYQNRP